MKIFRYRKPSLKTILGITGFKRKVKRALGLSAVESVVRLSRVKQKIKYRLGWYSKPVSFLRQAHKGKFPSLLGFFSVFKKPK